MTASATAQGNPIRQVRQHARPVPAWLVGLVATVAFVALIRLGFGLDDRWVTPLEQSSSVVAADRIDAIVTASAITGPAVIAAARSALDAAQRHEITGRDRELGTTLNALFDGAKSCHQFTVNSLDGNTNPRLEEFRKIVCEDYSRDAAELRASLRKSY